MGDEISMKKLSGKNLSGKNLSVDKPINIRLKVELKNKPNKYWVYCLDCLNCLKKSERKRFSVKDILDDGKIDNINLLNKNKNLKFGKQFAKTEFLALTYEFTKATDEFDDDGIPEVVENGVNGFIIEPGDYKLLEKHITTLASDSAYRKEILNWRS